MSNHYIQTTILKWFEYLKRRVLMDIENLFTIYVIHLSGKIDPKAIKEIEDRCCYIKHQKASVMFALAQDQAELHGIFKRLRNMGIVIISLKQVKD